MFETVVTENLVASVVTRHLAENVVPQDREEFDLMRFWVIKEVFENVVDKNVGTVNSN